jgi:TRAP-type C4-dicarboxylate transport system permease small subunit
MFEQRFDRICDRLVIWIKRVISVLFCAMLLIIMTQIVVRNFLALPTPWTEEATTYLMIYITFIGGIALMIRGQHLAIDLVTERSPRWARQWFEVSYHLVYLFVCTWLVIYGTELCMSPLIRRQNSISFNFPRGYVYMVVPITMTFCDIY